MAGNHWPWDGPSTPTFITFMAEQGVDVPLWDDEALLAVVERECPDPNLDLGLWITVLTGSTPARW